MAPMRFGYKSTINAHLKNIKLNAVFSVFFVEELQHINDSLKEGERFEYRPKRF